MRQRRLSERFGVERRRARVDIERMMRRLEAAGGRPLGPLVTAARRVVIAQDEQRYDVHGVSLWSCRESNG
jgi:uncharacterized protein with von Willebrand factor type A (vWA) domain